MAPVTHLMSVNDEVEPALAHVLMGSVSAASVSGFLFSNIPTALLHGPSFFFSVTLGCGGRSMENCTYFSSDDNTAMSTSCAATICKADPSIVQVLIQ